MATGKTGILTWTSGSFTVQVNWSETYEISSNTSNLTVDSIQVKSTKYSGYDYYPSGSVKINGVTMTPKLSSTTPYGYVYITSKDKFFTLKTKTSSSASNVSYSLSNISHNQDGSQSIDIELNITFYSVSGGGGSGWKVTGAQSIDLTTIPRASTLGSLTCSTKYFDGTMTYKYTPQSSAYYNKCDIYLKFSSGNILIRSTKIGKKSTSQQTNTVTLSTDELTKIYSKLSATTTGSLIFNLMTYSDSNYSTQIGEVTTKNIALTIPTNIKPTLGTITLNPHDITTKDGTSRNILVKGKNKIDVSISGCAAGNGSSIKSYKFEVLSGSTVIHKADVSTTSTSASATFGPFSQTGSLKFRITITDARTRSASNSGSESTWECYDYSNPYFSSFNAYRANEDGSVNMNGSHIKCDYTPVYSSVNSTNNVTVTAHYSTGTESNSQDEINGSILINLNGNTTATYNVYLSIVDNYDGFNKSSAITIFGESRILNISQDGMGVAIGKLSEKTDSHTNGLFECAFDAEFHKAVTLTELTEPLSIENGGTGAIDTATALTNLGAAAAEHKHSTSDITSGILGVARGGTGKATHTANAVLTGNGTSAVNNVAAANGAFFSTGSGVAPKFGTLPVKQGGTGATSEAAARAALGTNLVQLWKNGSPSSSFKAQDISIAGGNFNCYVILPHVSSNFTDVTLTQAVIAHKGESGHLFSLPNNKIARRKFTINSAGTSVAFESAEYSNTYGANKTDNMYAIPMYIYGYYVTIP